MYSRGLSPLTALSDVLAVFFQKFRESVKKAEWPDGIASHQRILDCLRENRTAEAERELREHVESHRSRLDAGNYREGQ